MKRTSDLTGLDYLYSLQLTGIKLGLDNMRELLERLGRPQDSLRCIHLAGTNGKGSTAAALAAILHAAGIPAGLYTSPHLHHFSERIRIDTRQISAAETGALIAEIKPHAAALGVTFFEFATAMALLAFQRRGLSWAILETGLGGRLDATNVVSPELCLITPIACDHTAWLGSGLAEIAAEKAGICKPGVPVLSAAQPAEALAVLRRIAEQRAAPLQVLERGRHWSTQEGLLHLEFPDERPLTVRPRLVGAHQHENLALAAGAAVHLAVQGVPLGRGRIRQGLEQVCWPGRLEWLPGKILLDGAHNPAGAGILAAYLRAAGLDGLQLIFGCKADKAAAGILEPLLPFAAEVHAVPPPVEKARPPAELADLAGRAGIPATSYASPRDALERVLRQRKPGQPVLVAGSLFLVAAIRGIRCPQSESLAILAPS